MPIMLAGDGPLVSAVTAVVNIHGALILSPLDFPEGAELEIQNLKTGESARFTVVWNGGEERLGAYKLGVELIQENPRFWGVDFAAMPAAPPQGAEVSSLASSAAPAAAAPLGDPSKPHKP
jgi:hypothetical protein